MATTILYDRYASPEALASDAQLSSELRIRELESWAADLTARLKASDESMTSSDPGATSELLRRVLACAHQLDARNGGNQPEVRCDDGVHRDPC
jgi:hypothetical protein